jgi:cytochrome c oxidase cbb3-type subunit 3
MLEEHEHKHAVHEFDGIIENRVSSPPIYFTILFYGLIIWGVAFCAFYLLSGWSSEGEFEQKMAAHQEQHQQANAAEPPAAKPAEEKVVAATQESAKANGAALYAQRCAMCHGAEGKGGVGPDLTTAEYIYGKSSAEVTESIANGRPEGMPGFAEQLSEDELTSLVDYVLSM